MGPVRQNPIQRTVSLLVVLDGSRKLLNQGHRIRPGVNIYTGRSFARPTGLRQTAIGLTQSTCRTLMDDIYAPHHSSPVWPLTPIHKAAQAAVWDRTAGPVRPQQLQLWRTACWQPPSDELTLQSTASAA